VGQVGDEVVVPGGVLRVVAMDGRRIERVAFVADPYTDVHASE
jgi:CBS domain containing-hemolysin-like protein